MKRFLRIAGTILAGAGLLAAVWALTVWQWQDPFTALYTSHQQRQLAADYEHTEAAYVPALPRRSSVRDEQRRIARAARRYRARLETGGAVGRLRIPRLDLNTIVVNGTDEASLAKGPGRYLGSYVPGEGELVYIAGHRTTYGAPFANIQRLRKGDEFTIKVPYGLFVYRVSRHAIVAAGDVDRLRSPGYEVIALQACHPRFFATERYIVYAKPVRVEPRGGTAYRIGGTPS